jgi:hypothetical protein
MTSQTIDTTNATPVLSNSSSLDDLRKAFFKHAQDVGKTVGEGKQAISDFAIDIVQAAQDGIIRPSEGRRKKGDTTPIDSEVMYDKYLTGQGKTLTDAMESNKDSVKKQVSYFERFINLGAVADVSGFDAADMLRRARAIINEYSRDVAAAKAAGEEATPLKGGTYQNLYNIAGEQLRVEDNQQVYLNDAGDKLRAMTDDELRSFVTPEGKQEASELKRAQALAKSLEDMGSKFQAAGVYEAMNQILIERIKELQAEDMAEKGIELVFKPGQAPLTDKQMKVLADAQKVRSSF